MYAVPHSSPEVSAQFPILCMYLMGSNWSSAYRSASRGKLLLLLLCIVRLQLGSMWVRVRVSRKWLGLACGLVLRLGLVPGLYKWLFCLATVRQLNNVYKRSDRQRSPTAIMQTNSSMRMRRVRINVMGGVLSINDRRGRGLCEPFT